MAMIVAILSVKCQTFRVKRGSGGTWGGGGRGTPFKLPPTHDEQPHGLMGKFKVVGVP
jgi:hypothetical protein